MKPTRPLSAKLVQDLHLVFKDGLPKEKKAVRAIIAIFAKLARRRKLEGVK